MYIPLHSESGTPWPPHQEKLTPRIAEYCVQSQTSSIQLTVPNFLMDVLKHFSEK